MPENRTPDLDGWNPVICERNELPTEFFEYASPKGNIALFKENDLWYVRKNSAEHIADGVPYCEADKKVFENFDIHIPAVEKMSKYGVRVCG